MLTTGIGNGMKQVEVFYGQTAAWHKIVDKGRLIRGFK